MARKTTKPKGNRPRRWAVSSTVAAILFTGVGLTGGSEQHAVLEQIATFDGWGEVMSLRWNPQGTELAAASSDPTIRLRTIPGGKLAGKLIGHGSYVYDLDWKKGGRLLASAACNGGDGENCETGGVIVWDVESRSLVRRLPLEIETHAVASRMEQKEGKPSAIDPHSQPGADARAVAWSKDGRYLAVGGGAGTVKIWDTATWKVIHESKPHWAITDMAWSQDGRLAVAARDNTVSIWEFSGQRTARITHVLEHHTLDVYAVAWHPTLPLLASSSGDRTVVIWDARREEIIHTLKDFDGAVRSVAWRLDGSHLAATAYTLASGAGEIWVYDTRSWQRVARGIGDKERTFRSIAWSPDGNLLASGGTDYVIKLWRFTP